MSNIDFVKKTVVLTGDGFLHGISNEWLAEMRVKGFTIKDLRDPAEKPLWRRFKSYGSLFGSRKLRPFIE